VFEGPRQRLRDPPMLARREISREHRARGEAHGGRIVVRPTRQSATRASASVPKAKLSPSSPTCTHARTHISHMIESLLHHNPLSTLAISSLSVMRHVSPEMRIALSPAVHWPGGWGTTEGLCLAAYTRPLRRGDVCRTAMLPRNASAARAAHRARTRLELRAPRCTR